MALPTLRMIAFILGIFLITLAISMGIPVITQLSVNAPRNRQHSDGYRQANLQEEVAPFADDATQFGCQRLQDQRRYADEENQERS